MAKNLDLVLKHTYYDQIIAGQKTIEYRLATAYWQNRLMGTSYDTVTFRRGYTSESVTVRITYIDLIWYTHEFFSEEPALVFAIGFEM